MTLSIARIGPPKPAAARTVAPSTPAATPAATGVVGPTNIVRPNLSGYAPHLVLPKPDAVSGNAATAIDRRFWGKSLPIGPVHIQAEFQVPVLDAGALVDLANEHRAVNGPGHPLIVPVYFSKTRLSNKPALATVVIDIVGENPGALLVYARRPLSDKQARDAAAVDDTVPVSVNVVVG